MRISNSNADFAHVTAYRDCRRRAAVIVVADHDGKKNAVKYQYANRQFRSLAMTAPQAELIFLKKRTT